MRPLRLRGALNWLAFVAVAATLTGCGGGISAPRALNLTLSPSETSVHVRDSAQFQVVGYSAVPILQWSVNGIIGGNLQVGTVDSNGVYQAPAVPPTPNVITVTALSADFTATAEITILNPAPEATAVSPGIQMQGASQVAVTVTGSGFTAQSQVVADGVLADTTFVSAGSLQAVLPDAMMQTQGSHSISVQTPQPGGGTSSSLSLLVMSNGTVSPSRNPLVARYDIQVPRDAHVAVDFGPNTAYGQTTSEATSPAGGGPVEVQVAGMTAATTYHMRARVTFADGATVLDEDHEFTTGAIPASRVPNLKVTRFNGSTPSPGVEMLDLIFGAAGSNLISASVVNLDGQIIWYYDPDPGATVIPLKQLPNGHFLLYIDYTNHINDSLREIDLAGNTIRDLKRTDLNNALAARGFAPVDQFHHDVLPLPNGHIILLCNVTKQISGLTGYSTATAVQGDILVDLDPDLNPVWQWSAFDHLDPNRHLQGLPDWTHSNAVIYTPTDGNLLVSIRHQSWIVKIDYQNGRGTGAILWRFGDQGDFTLTNGDRSAWQYAQHYPRVVTIDGSKMRLEVMDNGNLRMDANGIPCGTAGGAACYSRVAMFDLDEQSRTATPVWEYRPGFYSFWGGSAELLGNGDIEGAFSASVTPGTGSRVVEVTPGDNPQPVWQLDIGGESAYRGFRIPSLYPGVQW